MSIMKRLDILIFIILLTETYCVKSQVPIISTTLGLVSGVPADDGDYNMYLGMPFGQVDPSNPFGPASPHQPYDGIFNAIDDTVMCPQREEFNNTLSGTIDCLHISVFVPSSADQSQPLPVLVWFYGGGYVIGYKDHEMFGPKFLIRHGVIVVTFNYRVGPFGFMCTDNPRVPGNQGLKDQLLALQWIQDNIRSFGGDPNRVTAVGNSAGSMSVEFQVLRSRSGQRLFNQVIMQSGSSYLTHFGPRERDIPITLAQYFGFYTENMNQALDYLANVDRLDIIAAVEQLGYGFRPCIEREFDGVESFLTFNWIDLDEIPAARGLRVLIGFNDNEGAMYNRHFQGDIDSLAESALSSVFDIENDEFSGISTMTNFYFGDERRVNDSLLQEYGDMRSDLSFAYPTLRGMDRYLRNGVEAVYLYMFSYHGGRNFARIKNNWSIPGATHADELGYLFDVEYLGDVVDSMDELILNRMCKLWTNFVKYGDPTPEISELLPVKWEPITSPSAVHYYMNINTTLSLENRPFEDRVAFWDLFYHLNGHLHILNTYIPR